MSAPSDLFLDIGNTRIKWAYRQKDTQRWVTGYSTHDDFPQQRWPFTVRRIIVASVREHPDLLESLTAEFGEHLYWLSAPVSDYLEFRHCYVDSARLGVDRWLAMLGARQHHCGDVLVIDAGTALTLDMLDKHQQHQGGWIVPGLRMAQQALFQQTQRVNPYPDEQNAEDIGPGQTTLSCVSAGVKRQLLALVASVMEDYSQYKVFVCGGDGEWLARELKSSGMSGVKIHHAPHLIFDGMESLCAGSFLL